MMRSPAFVALARPTFDLVFAAEMAHTAYATLIEGGMQLQGSPELITDLQGADEAARMLAELEPPLILVFQATFADTTLITTLTDRISAPILLWAVPEPPSGERLRLNSLCGINLAAHALTLRNHPYGTLYLAASESSALSTVQTYARAAEAYSRLKTATLGVLGDHPPGMDSCHLDAPMLQTKLGIRLYDLEIRDLIQYVQKVDSSDTEQAYQELEPSLEDLGRFDRAGVEGTLSTFVALQQLATEHELDGIALRCWPEFFTDLGCAACGAVSLLSEKHIPSSCEADANGTLTQMILGWLSGGATMGADMVFIDEEEDLAVLWHCGLAPLSMADPSASPRAALHSNRSLPLVMEFPLKPGRITLARISRATGSLVMAVATGEMMSAPLSYSGTSGVLRFDRPAGEVLNEILKLGLEHHISFTYGDHKLSLITLAEWLNIPVLELT
jgi:L-fucose isomerase-like protein